MNKQDLNKKNQKFTQRAGDKVERTGEKISEKGMPKVGSDVRNVGNKIEHFQDKK